MRGKKAREFRRMQECVKHLETMVDWLDYELPYRIVRKKGKIRNKKVSWLSRLFKSRRGMRNEQNKN